MHSPQPHPPADQEPEIKIGKTSCLVQRQDKEVETSVFTLSLGGERIDLLPFKNWGQLDVHKWQVRGKLPATPAGLEITPDHVKVAGETVSVSDPEGCPKLERIMNQWLALEKGTLELARRRSQAKTPAGLAGPTRTREAQPLRYHVEVDHESQVHIKCTQGKTVVGEIGLTLTGLQSLINQGLLRKPRALKVGALHDWVELDGVLYSFEKGHSDAAKLEAVLNEHYLSSAALGQGKNIVVLTNAASSTGFDMQFTATLGGVPDSRRRPLNEATLELLQDHQRCGLLHKNLVVKLIRPTLVFKQKTPDGGEHYLESTPENKVVVAGDDAQQQIIDLSQPVNYLHLSAVELTAVFNHPVINQHSQSTPAEATPVSTPGPPKSPEAAAAKQDSNEMAGPSAKAARPTAPAESHPALLPPAPARQTLSHAAMPEPGGHLLPSLTSETGAGEARSPGKDVPQTELVAPKPAAEIMPRPNGWLEPILEQAQMSYDWFNRLVYLKLAEKFGNSREGHFGPLPCWHIALSGIKDIADPAFHGIFLTAKGGLGFLHDGHLARFYKGMAFIGTTESALEGIEVALLAVGLDARERLWFIVSDGYASKFGIPEKTVAEELRRLQTHGAGVLSKQEALESLEPIQVAWTVPAAQSSPEEPEALESGPLSDSLLSSVRTGIPLP